MLTQAEIVAGFRELGLNGNSAVLVHSSLRSFGTVDGGAATVCEALVDVCGTVMVPSGTWDLTGVPFPPDLVRPNNAQHNAADWEGFEKAMAAAVPYSPHLPIDRWLGIVPETLRRHFAHRRTTHPLFGFLAVGTHADRLVAYAADDWSLGPIAALADLGGDVLLLGVDHATNTTIHLAEQQLGRSSFSRCAKVAEHRWAEIPNISGESHRFDEIEPELRSVTAETEIGDCRARRISVADVLATTERLITSDPKALLCDDPECRCGAAYRQRVVVIGYEQT